MEIRSEKEYQEFSATGTTTNADVAALDLDTRRKDSICLLIKNLGTNSLTYTLTSKAKYGGDLSKTESTAAIANAAAGVTQVIVTAKFFAEYIVYVKSTVADTPTTYLLRQH